jgi:DNA-directed RNA polymerase specialized sigma24 family protein
VETAKHTSFDLATRMPDDGELALAYSAARVAARREEEAIAATVTAAAQLAADRTPGMPTPLLVLAVRRAVTTAPALPLASLPPDEREAIALARLAALTVAEIATATDTAPAQVRRQLTDGLRRLTRMRSSSATAPG